MKKRITIVLAASGLFLLLHTGSAIAQQPATASTASPPAATSAPAEVESTPAEDDSGSRPWIRLVWLVPLAAAVGAGSIFGRRLLTERGWLDAA